jgi:hypothetical protein
MADTKSPPAASVSSHTGAGLSEHHRRLPADLFDDAIRLPLPSSISGDKAEIAERREALASLSIAAALINGCNLLEQLVVAERTRNALIQAAGNNPQPTVEIRPLTFEDVIRLEQARADHRGPAPADAKPDPTTARNQFHDRHGRPAQTNGDKRPAGGWGALLHALEQSEMCFGGLRHGAATSHWMMDQLARLHRSGALVSVKQVERRVLEDLHEAVLWALQVVR